MSTSVVFKLKNKDNVDVAALRQRLFRLEASSSALSQTTIKILERLTITLVTPEPEDVAGLVDRLHDVFNEYAHLTRCTLWHDAELDDPAV